MFMRTPPEQLDRIPAMLLPVRTTWLDPAKPYPWLTSNLQICSQGGGEVTEPTHICRAGTRRPPVEVTPPAWLSSVSRLTAPRLTHAVRDHSDKKKPVQTVLGVSATQTIKKTTSSEDSNQGPPAQA
ncbi:hypothetical protein PGT21_035495 [Puccinia graminis f. sp. tritici]|uniref:Uncharacterized protein n=1 Tax=Puccinia graminis f. sp. tritici TaxID=56615 RepID=A0A5B0PZY4_PUCGR|nr:hypothetical protein PGT21_035495 [Puccinia graminis f. sp. tritici]KAA1126321.1 hypothetical protein PGTUg99_026628 [Puccinia graminis f. sp. tritici]